MLECWGSIFSAIQFLLQDNRDTLGLMKHLILATDVATHLRLVPTLEAIVKKGLQLTNEDHRKHLLALCMTASDLSDQTKDWDTTLKTSVWICLLV